MGFIMPGWLRKVHKTFVLVILISLTTACVWSEEFAAVVHNVTAKFENTWVELDADIDFRLSPTANEALQKGVPLTWMVLIRVEREGNGWNTTIQEQELNYQIKNHALLNLYSVEKISSGVTEMFSSLTGALNSISKIRNLPIIDKQRLQPGECYHIAIKVKFDREALPIPLRPTSYFDSQWALSSHWVSWQLQN